MSKFPEHNDWVRSFYVSNPTLHKKGYTVYKVVSKVFPKNSVEAASQVVVWKRYSDFRKLSKALLLIYQGLHLKGNFPKFAKANFFGRFEEEVVEERRLSALRLLEFAAQYPVLFNSQVFVKFFERCQDLHDDPSEMPSLDPPLLAQPSKPIFRSNGILSESCSEESWDSSIGGTGSGDCFSGCPTSPKVAALDSLSVDSRSTEGELNVPNMVATKEASLSDIPSGFSSSDLAEFDPVLQSHGGGSDDCSSLSNTWILSAADTCANMANDGGSWPSTFVFPESLRGTELEGDTDDWLRMDQERSSGNEGGEEKAGPSGEEVVAEFSPGTPVSPLDADPQEAAYLQAAANWASCAHASEAQGDFLAAFSHYKAAVATLLEGVQGDRNAARRDAVRRKTAQYLARAERIYESQLSQQMGGERRWSLSAAPQLPLATPATFPGSSLRGPVQELSKYKVIGVVGTVLLALDSESSNTVVIKVLHKSPCLDVAPSVSVVPQEVPHMVRLLRVYETECSLYLVLEYASGGRLWDYLGSYVRRHQEALLPSSSPDCPRGSIEEGPRPHTFHSPGASATSGPTTLPLPSDCDITISDYEVKVASLEALSVPKCRPASKGPLSVELSHSKGRSHMSPRTASAGNLTASSFVGLSSSDAGAQQQVSSLQIPMDALSVSQERVLIQDGSENTMAQKSSNQSGAASRSGSAATTGRLSWDTGRTTPLEDDKTSEEIKQTAGAVEGSRERCLSVRAAEVFRHLDGMAKKLTPPRRLPESCIRLWAAEIALALSHLHRLGVLRKDLCPQDILLADGGHVVLTYCCQFNCVDRIQSQFARENQYCAPEIDQLVPVTPACDWWSFGAILYELFVGAPLVVCVPGGVTPTTCLSFPSHVSVEAADLLEKLLAYYPHQRLGHGPTGSEDVRSHPFFASVDWARLVSR